MNRQQKIPMSETLRKALDGVGAEPLVGPAFESEATEDGYSDARYARKEARAA
jgi:hypothetical protein